jgi:hypothetical protein
MKDEKMQNKGKMVAKMHELKKQLKHLKRRKFNENLRTIYAMI